MKVCLVKMVGNGFKDLPRGTASDKALSDKIFKIQDMIDINVELFQWIRNFLIKNLLFFITRC